MAFYSRQYDPKPRQGDRECPGYPAYPWLDQRGHNVLAQWGYVAEGLYTSDEQIKERNITQFGETYPGELVKPGDIMYKDLNGDGHIDEYDRECISRGDLPEIYYGIGGDLRYKNIGLGVLSRARPRPTAYSLATVSFLSRARLAAARFMPTLPTAGLRVTRRTQTCSIRVSHGAPMIRPTSTTTCLLPGGSVTWDSCA